ncbi:hypothetical protein ACG02S_12470 [Roseateles sp. DC23W]|uniref:Uncharacterized protein n=1 Tax=Pelomonas dachongensis TaxID=3299029 RepID=A0ABW7EMQ6_9BURK
MSFLLNPVSRFNAAACGKRGTAVRNGAVRGQQGSASLVFTDGDMANADFVPSGLCPLDSDPVPVTSVPS